MLTCIVLAYRIATKLIFSLKWLISFQSSVEGVQGCALVGVYFTNLNEWSTLSHLFKLFIHVDVPTI